MGRRAYALPNAPGGTRVTWPRVYVRCLTGALVPAAPCARAVAWSARPFAVARKLWGALEGTGNPQTAQGSTCETQTLSPGVWLGRVCVCRTMRRRWPRRCADSAITTRNSIFDFSEPFWNRSVPKLLQRAIFSCFMFETWRRSQDWFSRKKIDRFFWREFSGEIFLERNYCPRTSHVMFSGNNPW